MLLVVSALLHSADSISAFTEVPQAYVATTPVAGVTLHVLAAPEPPPPPVVPTRERLIALAQATWPHDPETAVRILVCESQAGDHPDTFSLEAENGGPMQLNRSTWEPYFAAMNGWTWEQLVTDEAIHFQAARIIYDRAGGWAPWRCR